MMDRVRGELRYHSWMKTETAYALDQQVRLFSQLTTQNRWVWLALSHISAPLL
jgi:hypothetical protein